MTTCTGKCHLCMENRHTKWCSVTPVFVCTQSLFCPILWDPVDCSSPGSSVHGILQARILEQIAIFFSRGSFWPRDQTHISCISCIHSQILFHWATRGSPSALDKIHWIHWIVQTKLRVWKKPFKPLRSVYLTICKFYLKKKKRTTTNKS